jgi:hypothetical protein
VQILDDCALTPDWYVVFTGNVDLLEGLYDVGDSPMIALAQAVDAEMPSLANHYSDKRGRYCAHGRRAKFEPADVWFGIAPAVPDRDEVWRFRSWKAGDGAAILDDPDRAQIRPPLGWSYSEAKIRNVGYAYPKQTETAVGADTFEEFPEASKPDQVYAVPGVDPVDRRIWSAERLLVKAGTTTGNTGAAEAKAYGRFWATVLATPRVRVDQVTFKSVPTGHAQAEQTWELMLNADIADVIDLEHGVAGGVGVSEDFYIEGSEMTVRHLNPGMDMVVATFNLSPAAYYADPMGLLGS